MKSIFTAAALPLVLAGLLSQMPAIADTASPMVLAQDGTSNTGDTFAPTNPGDAPLSNPSLDSGPPSELDNGGTSDSLRGAGEPGSTPSAGFSGNSSTSQSLSAAPLSGSGSGSGFGGGSSTSQSLSESPLSH